MPLLEQSLNNHNPGPLPPNKNQYHYASNGVMYAFKLALLLFVFVENADQRFLNSNHKCIHLAHLSKHVRNSVNEKIQPICQ